MCFPARNLQLEVLQLVSERVLCQILLYNTDHLLTANINYFPHKDKCPYKEIPARNLQLEVYRKGVLGHFHTCNCLLFFLGTMYKVQCIK